MTDYIKREDAEGIFVTAKEQVYTIDDVMEMLASADVAPVRHGRWINAQYPFSKCNQCGAYMDTVGNEANFCCVCGAKMDEEEE